MIVNKQKPEHSAWTEDAVQVHSIWHTIQGEGPHAGRPAIFIRLAGCNLQCPFCDTDYTSIRRLMTGLSIVENAMQIWHENVNPNADRDPLFVITGGEPFRQNLETMINELGSCGDIQIETNGTLEPDENTAQALFMYEVDVVVCPKTSKVNSYWLEEYRCHWKYIIEAGKVDDDGLPTSSLGYNHRVQRPPNVTRRHDVYLQPLDEQSVENNLNNQNEAIRCAMLHNHQLCLQIHKIAGLR